MYIHIPFCKSKCRYCDFLSSPEMSHSEAYVYALIEELKTKSPLYTVIKTIYIGGGTPSLLHENQIADIMKTIKAYYNVLPNAEITIEANPESITAQKLAAYKQEGINRISIGLQAYQNNILKRIGRVHDQDTFNRSIEIVKNSGIKNVNIDLMFGLPKQSYDEWYETMTETIKIKPQHISAYSLILEEGTDFYKKYSHLQPDDNLECDMYDAAKMLFSQNGYKHYEISNFALPSYESRHNISYWKCEEYLGIGLGAHSHLNGERFHNTKSFDEYFRCENKKYDVEKLTTKDKISEFMFLGLRMCDGILEQQFIERFGNDVDYYFKHCLERLQEQMLIARQNGIIKLTDRGINLSNIVFTEFLL